MTAYLSFEWLKFTHRWMPRIVLVLLIGILTLAFWGEGSRILARPDVLLPRGWLAGLIFASYFAPFFWPVLGGSWAGNEYGWGTIRSVLARRPQRVQQAVSALVILLAGIGLATLALIIAATVLGAIVGILTGHGVWTSGIFDGSYLTLVAKGFLAAWFVSAFYLILGYAAAVVFRSAAVGIGIGVGGTLAQFVLYRILFSLGGVWKTIADHFPINYAGSLVQQAVHTGFAAGTGLAETSPGDPHVAQSLLALSLYSIVFLAAMVVSVRRDVTS